MEASPDDGPCNRSPPSPEFRRGVARSELAEAESIPSEWTDEKHSQYLKSMETSFVNQLYDSMEILGWPSDKENLSDTQSQRHDECVYSPSGQFKVQRDGCWKKINFERPCSQSNTSAKSRVFPSSPWIRHFRNTSGALGLAASSDLCKVASSNNHLTSAKGKKAFLCVKSNHHQASASCLLGQAFIGNNAEVSDQNFAEDDLEVMDQNGSCSAKRTKTLGTNSPCNDQVVPFSEAAPRRDNTGERQSLLD